MNSLFEPWLAKYFNSTIFEPCWNYIDIPIQFQQVVTVQSILRISNEKIFWTTLVIPPPDTLKYWISVGQRQLCSSPCSNEGTVKPASHLPCTFLKYQLQTLHVCNYSLYKLPQFKLLIHIQITPTKPLFSCNFIPGALVDAFLHALFYWACSDGVAKLLTKTIS